MKNLRRKLYPLELVLLFAIPAIIVFFLYPSSSRIGTPTAPPTTNLVSTIPTSWTSEEMQTFLHTRLENLLTNIFPNGAYAIPEVQTRYTTLERKIHERYGKEFTYSVVNSYLPQSKFMTIASQVQDGTPTIIIFLPSLMDLFEAERKAGARNEDSDRSFVIDLLHELDHLAFGLVPKEGEVLSAEKWMENEQWAWGQTCEFTIRPMLENHRMKIGARHFIQYDGWVRSKRDASSPFWKAFVREKYLPLLQK